MIPLSSILELADLTAISWVGTAIVWATLAGVFRDKLFWYLSGAFFLIGAARIVNVQNMFSPDVEIAFVLVARALSAYLLTVGTLNGDARYSSTKKWLATSLILSVGLGIYTHNPGPSEPLSIGPVAFASSLGFIFASWKFARCVPEKFQSCESYGNLAWVFAASALLSILNVWIDTPIVLMILSIGGLVITGLLTVFGIQLGFDRHRALVECNREY